MPGCTFCVGVSGWWRPCGRVLVIPFWNRFEAGSRIRSYAKLLLGFRMLYRDIAKIFLGHT